MPFISQVNPGVRGIDCNTPLSYLIARRFFNHDYRFVVRYVGREEMAWHDLSVPEIKNIHAAGLALQIVQHVEEPNWIPTPEKGTKYGANASIFALNLGIPLRTCIWLDLEEVNQVFSTESNTIDYCNNWFKEVDGTGFSAGLYVGYNCGLNAIQLFEKLAFQRYWGAYNLDSDKVPIKRGLQMKQHVATNADVPARIEFGFDVNVAQADGFGSLPLAFAPYEWDQSVSTNSI